MELPALRRGGYSVIIDKLPSDGAPGQAVSDDAILARKQRWLAQGVGAACLVSLGLVSSWGAPAIEGAVYASDPAPLSLLNPVDDLGMRPFERTQGRPGKVWGPLLTKQTPLPTNSWYENLVLGDSLNDEKTSRVFAIPYMLDTAGPVAGVRTHGSGVKATANSVEQTWNPGYGMTLGCVEAVDRQVVRDTGEGAPRQFGIELQWSAHKKAGGFMSAPIVRGSPYTTMTYQGMTPKLLATMAPLNGKVVVDGNRTIDCDDLGDAGFNATVDDNMDPKSSTHFWVDKDVSVSFAQSNMEWLVFVSSPGFYMCDFRGVLGAPHQFKKPFFRFQAKDAFMSGGVRVALVNNCTTVTSDPTFCPSTLTGFRKHDRSQYAKLLKKHSGVYPSVNAEALFGFPGDRHFDPISGEAIESTQPLKLQFDWDARWFYDDAGGRDAGMDAPSAVVGKFGSSARPYGSPVAVELLMLALPHHRDVLVPTAESSNSIVMDEGACAPTLHGEACAAIGSVWTMTEKLLNVSFYAKEPIRPEMMADLEESLKKDLDYDLPANYRKGAGDTYFSGKMLARLARVVVISDQMGAEFLWKRDQAVKRLAKGVTVWLDGSSQNPFIYDDTWRGLASCGCWYDGDSQSCTNKFPDCPALGDMGNNFGFSFFNDHHFHLGYHLYASAVVGAFDHQWLWDHWEEVLVYVRDIANPSRHDPHFPAYRHKDWFLGSSWASGVVTIQDQGYPNGRNEESSAEAIAAYEAVALLGQAGMMAFHNDGDMQPKPDPKEMATRYDMASRVYDFGRLLMSTEVRSAQRYWHVMASPAPRVYPAVYVPKVVGMLWSTLAQEQTWFGAEEWKSYGIQLLPFTPAAAERDQKAWVKEMLPPFKASCDADANCGAQGWSLLVYLSMATIGDWEAARKGVLSLPDDIYEGAGGNGHSKSNSLWWIATRPGAPGAKTGNTAIVAPSSGAPKRTLTTSASITAAISAAAAGALGILTAT